MRIAIAGIAIESSTFSPHRAVDRDFMQWRGRDLVERYASIREDGPLADAATWLPVLVARSIPGGPVDAATYAALKNEIVDGLGALTEEAPLDGIFLDIHGAMSVDGMDDAEGDLITAIREVVGDDPLISASMDLHGNVTSTLAHQVDLITCFRLAPHEDAWETRDRAITNLVHVLSTGERVSAAWVPVPLLLPGEKTSTRVEPAKSLYARIPEITAREGVLDAAIWMGYPWADEPRCNATVIAIGPDETAIAQAAEELAQHLWDVRHDFEFVGPTATLAETVELGLASAVKPYLISDSGDNPGAGGTGDVTWTLAQLLADPRLTSEDAPTVYCASVFDSQAWQQIAAHAVGTRIDITVGARIDSAPHGPVRVQGTLIHRSDDDANAGGVAVIKVGGLHVIVTQHRKAYHAASDFAMIGLDPLAAQIIVTKIGYLEPELHAIAQGWTLALTPGAVDQNLLRMGHRRLTHPIIPFDDDGAFGPDGPNLRAQLIRR